MDIKDTREEIIKRSIIIKEGQRRRIKRILEGASVIVIALLVFMMSIVPYSASEDMQGTYYGTLIQGKDVGMYIIMGLICFVLGIITTIISLKYRDKSELINHNDD